jgi:hypothetical protein
MNWEQGRYALYATRIGRVSRWTLFLKTIGVWRGGDVHHPVCDGSADHELSQEEEGSERSMEERVSEHVQKVARKLKSAAYQLHVQRETERGVSTRS